MVVVNPLAATGSTALVKGSGACVGKSRGYVGRLAQAVVLLHLLHHSYQGLAIFSSGEADQTK